ncbi:PREDICTED: claudin domain-containing protein 2 [Condylura cristata]|uniref:claudin domain-containing protein 2 n=1 Tax=Condylura cristata TaxID=143302 RepID=UPI0006433AA7|nr:PREDICTED: claudin domain-containing protein 2 [Condylura cristata]
MPGDEASIPVGAWGGGGGFGIGRNPEGGGSPDSQKWGPRVTVWDAEGPVEGEGRGPLAGEGRGKKVPSWVRLWADPALWPSRRPPGMGVKRSLQSGGTILGFLANTVTILSTASNYWTQHHGGHSGLWQDCNNGVCSNIPCQTMLTVTGACMVLSAGCGLVGLVMALRILCHQGNSRGQATSIIFFFCGLLLLIALTGYTAKNAWKNNIFFSWSYFSGWLALPFSVLAGFCFLLADMIVQSTDAISGFPVCL